MYVLGSRVALALAPFSDGRFMQLAIVASDELDQVRGPIWSCKGMVTDTPGIYHVGFLQTMFNARLLREISIGQMRRWKQDFRLFIDAPANHAHLGGIAKPV